MRALGYVTLKLSYFTSETFHMLAITHVLIRFAELGPFTQKVKLPVCLA